MPRTPTLTKRQQLFCRLIAEGESIAQSYLKSGYSKTSIQNAGSAGSKLLKTSRIKSYLERMKQVQFEGQALSLAEKRAFLARAVRTPVGELHEGSDLAQELTVTEGKEGTSKKVKGVDKLRAIEIDSKIAGDFYADREPQAQNPFLFIVSLSKTDGAGLGAESLPLAQARTVEETPALTAPDQYAD